MTLLWQPTLLAANDVDFDASLTRCTRTDLAGGAWVDQVPGWARGTDALFDELLETAPWGAHERWMYDRMVAEPRLTTGAWRSPPKVLRAMSRALSRHYGAPLRSINANLYRNGHDSVAWHGDRVGKDRDTAIVAILTLGEPRRFLLRPKGGGRSLRFVPAHGDLLVLGGTCQRTWQHCVPKCAAAGPRISVQFRGAY